MYSQNALVSAVQRIQQQAPDAILT